MLLLKSLKKKEAGFCYIDTHAGCGSYDLQSEFACKNREFETGIREITGYGSVWNNENVVDKLIASKSNPNIFEG